MTDIPQKQHPKNIPEFLQLEMSANRKKVQLIVFYFCHVSLRFR
jgi:hypothetical protein